MKWSCAARNYGMEIVEQVQLTFIERDTPLKWGFVGTVEVAV